jgi:3-hydroxyisobutyrate dehydrogenase-like beta-hydroxyacid dehydrogenase
MPNSNITLGFIGTGQMGSRMIKRLLARGFKVHVYNREKERALDLQKDGALVRDSIKDVVKNSDVILSSVTNDQAVEEIYLSREGAVNFIKPGTIVIDLSSIRPETSRKVNEAVAQKGGQMIDAAVSGSIGAAEEGNLVIFVGGDREAYEKSKPILDILGSKSHYLGESGSGSIMKLVANTVLGIGMAGIAEAIRLGERAGLDKNKIADVLGQTAVVAPGFKLKLENIKKDEYEPAFKLSLMLKDMDNILDQAGQVGSAVPVSTAAEQLYKKAADQNLADQDFSIVFKTTEGGKGG